MDFQLTILGTGTSQGVPIIGCDCPVCQSTNPKDNRLRTSALLQVGDQQVSIDCGPDFRQQMLRAKVSHLDGLLFTHAHNDHIIGLDDVRPFNFRQKKDMPVYATVEVQQALTKRFDYVFEPNPYPGAPMVVLKTIENRPFEIEGIPIQPVQFLHGKLFVLGFRIGNLAYLTDMKTISTEEKAKLRNLKTLVINALHYKAHHSHLNLEEALALIEELAPEKAYLTHVSHRMGLYDEVNPTLPAGVELAYDGLVIHGQF
ncbi:MAG: MBL fold metallo-hydrolase [Saprospiraceae bacterium]|nr:MBL fold metallo-hydrolase [Saprospiraceae bacterium]